MLSEETEFGKKYRRTTPEQMYVSYVFPTKNTIPENTMPEEVILSNASTLKHVGLQSGEKLKNELNNL